MTKDHELMGHKWMALPETDLGLCQMAVANYIWIYFEVSVYAVHARYHERLCFCIQAENNCWMKSECWMEQESGWRRVPTLFSLPFLCYFFFPLLSGTLGYTLTASSNWGAWERYTWQPGLRKSTRANAFSSLCGIIRLWWMELADFQRLQKLHRRINVTHLMWPAVRQGRQMSSFYKYKRFLKWSRPHC